MLANVCPIGIGERSAGIDATYPASGPLEVCSHASTTAMRRHAWLLGVTIMATAMIAATADLQKLC